MSAVSKVPEWEEATERRLGIVESKVDKLLDPETGIYPKMARVDLHISRMNSRLAWLITSVLLAGFANVLLSYFLHK